MKPTPVSEGRAYELLARGDWVAEVKLDGYSGEIRIDERGRVSAMTVTRDVTALLPPCTCPDLYDSSFQVEWVAGERSTSAQVATLLSEGGWKRVEKPGAALLDCSRVCGQDVRGMPFSVRRGLRAVAAWTLNQAWEIEIGYPEGAMTKAEIQVWKERGEEGFVLKRLASPYKDGYSKDWRKVKWTSTVDAWVRRYVPGRGKYRGLVGALILELQDEQGNLVEVGRTSGMTDEMRRALTDRLKAGEQFCVEVKFDRWTSGGRLRHPRFKRLRPDKTAPPLLSRQKGG